MTNFTVPGGNAYSDDGTETRDMRNDGHRTWLLPMLSEVVSYIATTLSSITGYATTASAAAVTAVNAPGTAATSTTSMALTSGAKTLTVQTGKNFVGGMNIIVARTSDPVNKRGTGIVTAYDSVTGALDFTLTTTATGTYTDWTVSLAGEAGAAGAAGTPANPAPTNIYSSANFGGF